MLTGRQRLRSGILYIRVFYRPQVDDATRSRDGVIGIIPAIISPTQVTPMGPLDILLSNVGAKQLRRAARIMPNALAGGGIGRATVSQQLDPTGIRKMGKIRRAGNQEILKITTIHGIGQAKLVKIIDIRGTEGAFLGLGQSRQ